MTPSKPKPNLSKDVTDAIDQAVNKLIVGEVITDSMITSLKQDLVSVFSDLLDTAIDRFSGILDDKLKSYDRHLDEIDQSNRSMNLCFHGIPEGDGKQDEEKVGSIVKEKMNIEFGPEMIMQTRRIGKPTGSAGHSRNLDKSSLSATSADGVDIGNINSGSNELQGKGNQTSKGFHYRPVVVTFKNFKVKGEIWRSKKMLKSMKVLVTEDLTVPRRDLYKAVVNQFTYRNVWTTNGRVKFLYHQKVYTVSTADEYEDLLQKLGLLTTGNE